MTQNKILTVFQKNVLAEIGKSQLSRFLVWSGGTALAFYYLQHRFSSDLDFMSQELLRSDYLLIEIKNIAQNLQIQSIKSQKRLNRQEYWLQKKQEILKTEFVFYPFPFIKAPKKLKEFNLKIDSLEDMITNKVHAAYERSEPKDAFDIYCILQTRKIGFLQTFKWVKKKFGVEIDPVLFTSRLLQGVEKLEEIKPLVLKKEFFKVSAIQDYFQQEAKTYLRKKIPH